MWREVNKCVVKIIHNTCIFFLKLSKTYQSNIIYPWAMSLPYLSVSVSHSRLQRCPLTLPDHLIWFQAVHAQPSRWITPLPHPPLGTDSHPSSSVCALYHSPHIFTELHFPPQLEKHHLLGQIPNQPPPPNPSLLKPPRLLLHTQISTAGSNTCSFTSLPVVRNAHPPPESNPFACIFLVFVQRFCAFYVCWKKAVGLPFAFWRCSRLPQLRLYFQ